jgi:CDP-diacylglycerol--glycerol-3-phosphate 3-phosphatidyltransferase
VNVPNALSLLRLGIALPLLVALRAGRLDVAALLLAVALLTDLLDGAVARRWNLRTELGRVLDPLADKVLVAGALVMLAAGRRVPFELAAVVILRDLLLVGVGWLRFRGGAPMPSATILGKLAFGILGGYLGGVVVGVAWPAWVPALVGAIYAAAGLSYARRLPRFFFGRVLKEER